ncbi:MAG TPA: hypothetical protein PKA28_03960 [Methylomusa anaerophila]|uniref:DUF5666 domain-containing protein n=1 Tax=Methylomusa anaerophila TaxID=1930071 RepID=A0A348ANB3_9FIRM|nr:hypothetical protein [Methylomusa anaerophila]BBB92561.1 hypothetical protein MAMMFC1_03256 [Methylomusa anaerophila]HML87584.1 hypothetical protein [Methylomusa anaerophila]
MIKTFIAQAKNTVVANKKKLYGIVVLAALIGILTVGAHAMFQVRGVVTGVGNNSITVANFFRTQTVDLTGSTVNTANIKIGDKVKIQKDLHGNVLYARTSLDKDGEHDDD